MALRLVKFDIRRENSVHQQKMVMPMNVNRFFNEVKTGLHMVAENEITVFYPESNGKLIEIKSDDDIKYLNAKKLHFHARTKEIICSVELLVMTQNKQAPQAEIMALSQKIDDLKSQLAEMNLSINKVNMKLEENTLSILNRMMSLNVSQTNSDISNTISLGEQNSSTDNSSTYNSATDNSSPGNSPTNSNSKSQLIPKQRTVEIAKMVPNIPMTLPRKFTTLEDQTKIETAKNRDELQKLLDKLNSEGFTNRLRNIIILKRFHHDIEKTISHLKANP